MARKPTYINPYKLFYGAIIPNWLMPRTELSFGAKVMYARLTQYAGENGHCFPSHGELSQELGVTDRQIRTLLSELITVKLIEKRRVGSRKNNRYYFRMHPWQRAHMRVGDGDRKNPSCPDRKNTSAPTGRILPVQIGSILPTKSASTPSAPKPSGRLRESVVRESVKENQTTTPLPPTSLDMAPSLQTVEVGQPVAVAQGKETTATDGIMAGAGVSPFDTFWRAYPHHKQRGKAKDEWDRQQLDGTLPDILEALSWQRTLTGDDTLLKCAWLYLENTGWLDARPVAPMSPSTSISREMDAPHCGQCEKPLGVLDASLCDAHARADIRTLAARLCQIISYEHPHDAQDCLTRALDAFHPGQSARFMAAVNGDWPEKTADSLAAIIEDMQVQIMAESRVAAPLVDAAVNLLAVVNASRQYGELNLEKMMTEILQERSLDPHLMAVLPWEAWQRGGIDIPSVDGLVELMRAAIQRDEQEAVAWP